MKGSSNTQPSGLVSIGRQIQVRWNIERTDYTDENGTHENWTYDYANVDKQDNDSITEGVVRSMYSQHKAEALIAKHLSGDDAGEYAAYLRTLKLAEAVASGKYLKSELAEFEATEVGDVIGEIVTTLNDKGIIP
jgi:hypothetical protein